MYCREEMLIRYVVSSVGCSHSHKELLPPILNMYAILYDIKNQLIAPNNSKRSFRALHIADTELQVQYMSSFRLTYARLNKYGNMVLLLLGIWRTEILACSNFKATCISISTTLHWHSLFYKGFLKKQNISKAKSIGGFSYSSQQKIYQLELMSRHPLALGDHSFC